LEIQKIDVVSMT